MKKIMKPFVLVAAAAMSLASCQKNEFDAPQKQELHFTIKAGIETKTSITDNGDGTYSPSWHKDDKIAILFTEDKTDKLGATFSNVEEDGEIASFEGTATVVGEGTLYAFYPASAFDQHYGDETIRLDLPAAQKPSSTSFDPACDILVAKPCYYISDGDEVLIDDLYFARLMSVLKINLKGEFAQGEIVESLTFSVDGVDITGNAKVDYKTATIKGWNNGSVDRNVVTASYSEDRYITIAEEGNNAAYLVIAPTTIPAGTSLSFTLKTANYNISKTISAPSDMTFTAGNLSVLNLTINEENCEANDTPIDYSGVYLIAGKEEDKWYAAKKYTSGNYLSVSEIEFIGENIVETETISDHYMTINKVADAPYKGMYTIVDAGGKYLSAVSGDDNYLKAVDAVSDNTYWSIEKDEEKGTYSIVASKSSDAEKNHMRFNYNNGTNSRVTCYGSSSTQPYLTLFSTSLVKEDTTPRITLAKTSDLVSYDATSYEFTYTTKNISGEVSVTIKEGATMSNVSASANEGTVTVTFDPNSDTEQKTATIVLSYEGADPQEFVLTQAGKPVTGEPIEVTDVLTRSTTGVTGRTYSDWSGKKVTSSAIYAGNSAGGNEAIQLRSDNNNSGVVTTTSGGKVKKIKVTWQSSTSSGRTLDIYGKNTAYTSASDLYDTNTHGTKLGSIVCGTSTELVVNGEYEFIGLRSKAEAMYLSEIAITWETSGSGGEVTPDPTPDPSPDPTTYTYTFTSRAWADATSSWTSGKDGSQMKSGRGVLVSTTSTEANATCNTSMSNIQKVVFVYSTNASTGAGSIKVSIGSQEKTLDVTKTGGETDRNLEFDFSDSPLSGQLKFTVTCTTNSIYIKSVSITAD